MELEEFLLPIIKNISHFVFVIRAGHGSRLRYPAQKSCLEHAIKFYPKLQSELRKAQAAPPPAPDFSSDDEGEPRRPPTPDF